MKIVLIMCFFYPLYSYAVYEQVYKGYQNSNQLKALKYDETLNQLDFKINKNKNNWIMSAGYKNSNSYLESLLSFSNQQTLTQTYNLSLKKDTFKYGSFTFSHTESAYDLSQWGSTSLSSLSGEDVYETKNTFTYEYDFLKRSTQLDWEAINKQDDFNSKDFSLRHETDYLDFFHAYINAKHKILLERLYKEFELKAKKRVKFIAGRVRDGLSRSVELDQAKLNLLNQQETILSNEDELKEKVSLVEEVIGMRFSPSDYLRVNWSYKKIEDYFFITEVTKELELERLKELNKINELALEKLKSLQGQSLVFSAAYAKNSFDENRGKAFSNSWGEGVNDEKVVALVYSIPIGESNYKYQKKKLLELRHKNILTLKNKQGEIDVKRRVLTDNLKRFGKRIVILDEKLKFSKSILLKNQRLYKRGQISFDELLRSEETLTSNQLNRVNTLLQYESSLVSLAYLNGNIIKFLNKYTD